MADRAVNNYRRKSMINLQLHTEETFEDLVRKKLECGKFLTTKTGWIKLLGVLTLIAALAMFFGVTACSNVAPWYPFLFPITIGISIIVQSVLYLIFSLGLSVRRPTFWIKMDIMLNSLFSIISIISSVMTYSECNRDQFQRATGALGITGAIVLLIGCAAIFLLYRYKREEPSEQSPMGNEERMDPRKSMHA